MRDAWIHARGDPPGVAILERLSIERTREGEDLWVRDGVVGDEARSEGVGVVCRIDVCAARGRGCTRETTHRTIWKSPTATSSAGVCERTPTSQTVGEMRASTRERDTHVIGSSVPKDIIKRLRLRHILCRLSNDNGQLDLIVGQVHLDRLGDAGNVDRRIGSDYG